MDQNEENIGPKDPATNKSGVDISKILLPKKEQSVDSSQRVNAGALLAQEAGAAAAGIPESQKAQPPKPPAAPPKAAESSIKPLQTYQGDVERMVEHTPVSVVSIAAAEAERRAKEAAAPPGQKEEERSVLARAGLIGGGVLLVSVALGLVAYFATRPTTTAVTPLATAAPFIAVDDTVVVPAAPSVDRATLMQELDDARKSVHLSLGLIARLKVTTPGTDARGNTTQTDMPAQTLISTLAPYAPQSLLRTLTGSYLLGVHSYDANDGFLILGTDSYETAYAGMLAWETSMQQDFAPLLVRMPPVRSNDAATTTPQASILPTAFVDRVVDNHDARVIENQYGDIIFMWTFIDRNTIVITNNGETLREILVRAPAAVQALPQ